MLLTSVDIGTAFEIFQCVYQSSGCCCAVIPYNAHVSFQASHPENPLLLVANRSQRSVPTTALGATLIAKSNRKRRTKMGFPADPI